MPNCVCPRVFGDPALCKGCSFLCNEGLTWLLPIDPGVTEVIFDEDEHGNSVITLRKKTI